MSGEKKTDILNKQGVQIIRLQRITEDDVDRAIKKLKNKRSLGPDGIPSYVYKGLREFLLKPLTHIYNLSISTNTFSNIYKLTKVTPVPKTEDNTEVSNHRPIAQPSVPAKIFESIIREQIFVQIQNCITVSQHGFYTGKGVNTNLACFVQYVSEQIDAGLQVDTIYTDFQKAFDRVNHEILIEKMGDMEFTRETLQVFKSYLKGRTQYVKYKDCESKKTECPSGVPQGSNLGPLLFLIFINDIEKEIRHSRVLIYADDLKLYRKVENDRDCALLQEDINSLVAWSNSNKLLFNVKKCEKITYTRKTLNVINHTYSMRGETLRKTEQVTDLGILMDGRMDFSKNICEQMRKARRMLGFIMRTSKNFKKIETLKILYYAFVRSHLEFGSLVWNPASKSLSEKVETIQKRFLRYLYYKLFEYYPIDVVYGDLLRGFEMLALEKNTCSYYVLVRHIRGEGD